MLNEILHKDPFEDLYKGLSGSNRFQDSFEDGYAGKKQASNDRNYVNGYEQGKEHGTK